MHTEQVGADLVAKRRVYECDVSQSQQNLVWTLNQSNLIDAAPRQRETRTGTVGVSDYYTTQVIGLDTRLDFFYQSNQSVIRLLALFVYYESVVQFNSTPTRLETSR